MKTTLVCAFLLAPVVSLMAATTPAASDLAFFESKIRPVLVNNCYECHSTESGKSKGSLLLDTREGIRAGGERGPAVVPGNPEKSWLLTALKHTDPDLEMPPKKAQLAKAVIADFEEWIKRGAPDPREPTGKIVERPPIDLESGRKFWAYQKPVAHPQPAVKNAAWARRDLDYFVLNKLEQNSLAPSADAELIPLLRRLHFDLAGLPPTQAEAAKFVKRAQADGLDAAMATEADALLKSERFGERWARHWLDVARFAESSGKESNLTFPHAWRYRDYVIDAFNEDKPFNRFVMEQIAGDLLPAKSDAEKAQLLIATGFLAFGAKSLNEMNRAQFDADLADEQLDTITRAVLASSVACARCHDHKFDPFSMEDYYALAGIFKSTKTCFGSAIGFESNNKSDLIRLPALEGQLIPNKSMPKAKVAEIKAKVAALNDEEKKGKAAAKKAHEEGRNAEEVFGLRDFLRIYWSRGGLEWQLKTVDDEGHALPLCMGVQEGKVQEAKLLERGEITHPVKTVERSFPRVIELANAELPGKAQSGRLEFAQWLTHRDQPLTARVMANRVWRQLFGAGIVTTVDNFGFTGERPSHPELLDHLALKFIDGGWSVKSLIREIVLSRTYRQASTYRKECFDKDPDNHLLWRVSKRRLDAEVIRDSMLFVSGQLDTSRRKGSLVAEVGDKSVSLFGFSREIPADLDGCRYRSIYLPVIRDRLPDAIDLFDGAEASFVIGDRDVTNVPMQALFLMNSSFVETQAVALAKRVAKDAATQEERIRRAFVLCFNRAPDARETELANGYFKVAAAGGDGAVQDEQKVLASYCHALLSTAEFRNAD